jgi:hypothetical protein
VAAGAAFVICDLFYGLCDLRSVIYARKPCANKRSAAACRSLAPNPLGARVPRQGRVRGLRGALFTGRKNITGASRRSFFLIPDPLTQKKSFTLCASGGRLRASIVENRSSSNSYLQGASNMKTISPFRRMARRGPQTGFLARVCTWAFTPP